MTEISIRIMPGTVRLLVQLQHLAPTGASLNMASCGQDSSGIISAYGSRKDGRVSVSGQR